MYKILPLKPKVNKRIMSLPPAYKEKLEDVFDDIEANPYYHPTKKITQFKGNRKHEGWHYDLSYSLRIHYTINESDKTITIKYIGPHT